MLMMVMGLHERFSPRKSAKNRKGHRFGNGRKLEKSRKTRFSDLASILLHFIELPIRRLPMKMIRFVSMFAAGMLCAALAFAVVEKKSAQTAPMNQRTILQRFGFVDEDCDGFNDLARDADNDGIPNCQDPDWVRPRDGKGFQTHHGYMHQNVNERKGGPYNFSFNYLWNNNWANRFGPTDCPVTPSANQRRNGRANGRN
jgi:hypothetical protein